MTEQELIELCKCGEDTRVQYKREFSTDKKMAEEYVAFANTHGGKILLGVEDKTGEMVGLSYEQLQKCSSDLGHVANEQVRPTIYIETEMVNAIGKHFLVCYVAEGKNKPYKDLSGNIFVKQGADKRRVTDNTEILSMFQQSGTYYPEREKVTDSGWDDMDEKAVNRYLEKLVNRDLHSYGDLTAQKKILTNLHILSKDAEMTMGGLLFFGRNPQQYFPSYMIKAVAFYGNQLSGTRYRDSKDIVGTIPELFDQGMAFLKNNLHSIQGDQSVNSIGTLEVAEDALKEVLQNSLVHRDYLIPAPIRVLVFDDRVEIVSPGALAGGLTVEAVEEGDTFQRNPYLAAFCSQVMEYRGLGSGVMRAKMFCPEMRLVNSEVSNQVRVIIPRKGLVEHEERLVDRLVENEDWLVESPEEMMRWLVEKANRLGEKLAGTKIKILQLMAKDSTITIIEMAQALSVSTTTIDNHIQQMRGKYLRREGGDYGGRWVLDWK